MTDLRPEDPRDVEALIRAAGDYVRPSNDLRPRVLESARAEAAAQRTSWRVRGMLVAAVFVTLLLMSPRRESAAPVAPARLQHQDNPGWDTVEAVHDLRRRLALLWRSAL